MKLSGAVGSHADGQLNEPVYPMLNSPADIFRYFMLLQYPEMTRGQLAVYPAPQYFEYHFAVAVGRITGAAKCKDFRQSPPSAGACYE